MILEMQPTYSVHEKFRQAVASGHDDFARSQLWLMNAQLGGSYREFSETLCLMARKGHTVAVSQLLALSGHKASKETKTGFFRAVTAAVSDAAFAGQTGALALLLDCAQALGKEGAVIDLIRKERLASAAGQALSRVFASAVKGDAPKWCKQDKWPEVVELLEKHGADKEAVMKEWSERIGREKAEASRREIRFSGFTNSIGK